MHTRILAFEKIFEDVMLKHRRDELELYKLLANDAAFKSAIAKFAANGRLSMSIFLLGANFAVKRCYASFGDYRGKQTKQL